MKITLQINEPKVSIQSLKALDRHICSREPEELRHALEAVLRSVRIERAERLRKEALGEAMED